MESLETIITNIYSVLAYVPGTAQSAQFNYNCKSRKKGSLKDNIQRAVRAERRSAKAGSGLRRSGRLPGESDILARQAGIPTQREEEYLAHKRCLMNT